MRQASKNDRVGGGIVPDIDQVLSLLTISEIGNFSHIRVSSSGAWRLDGRLYGLRIHLVSLRYPYVSVAGPNKHDCSDLVVHGCVEISDITIRTSDIQIEHTEVPPTG